MKTFNAFINEGQKFLKHISKYGVPGEDFGAKIPIFLTGIRDFNEIVICKRYDEKGIQILCYDADEMRMCRDGIERQGDWMNYSNFAYTDDLSEVDDRVVEFILTTGIYDNEEHKLNDTFRLESVWKTIDLLEKPVNFKYVTKYRDYMKKLIH